MPGQVFSLMLISRIRNAAAFLFVVGSLTLTSVPAAASAAGTYDVWTCRGPDGSPAPIAGADGGWRSEQLATSPGGGNLIIDECVSGSGMKLALASTLPQPNPSHLLWIFQAPPSTSIERYELDFSGYSRPLIGGNAYGDVTISTDQQQDPIYDSRFEGAGIFEAQRLSRVSAGSSQVRVKTSCAPNGNTTCAPGADGAPARVTITRGAFSLADRDSPVVTAVSGDATTDAVWAGPTGIAVGASDQGGGVFRFGVEIDGEVKKWQYLAGAPCRPWPGTERSFLTPKPCPTTVGGMQQISTADLPDGVHTVRVVVEDAAGNQTTAYGPITKTLRRTADGTPTPGGPGGGPGGIGSSLAEPGPLNGSPAVSEARIRARWTGREGTTRSIRFDQRPKLDGQLTTPNGDPIKNAFVRVTIRRDARNSPAFDRDSLKTDSRGRFRWTLPKGVSSRSIKLAYHQRVNDTKPVTSTTLRLRVAAGLKLSLSRRTVRSGRSVTLSGTVIGRPIPGGGKLVELQARNPGKRWITFRTVRAKKSGRYVATYRFRKPGPATFQMRARARKSGDYPYSTGASPVRTIKVR